jgi:hypothetical protein
MMLARMESRYASYVGRVSEPRTYEVERGHVRRFQEALGAEVSDEVPPTFATCLRPNDPREGLDIDFRKLLHGEQEFTHHRPMKIGDRIRVAQKIAEAYVKSGKSGDLDMMVMITEGTDEGGAPVFTGRALVVIRR